MELAYSIDGEAVSKDRFYEFLRGLKEVKGTGFCQEEFYLRDDGTEDIGGTSGYDAEGMDGTRYSYRSSTTPEGTRATINCTTRG